jgi:hypothetical protein
MQLSCTVLLWLACFTTIAVCQGSLTAACCLQPLSAAAADRIIYCIQTFFTFIYKITLILNILNIKNIFNILNIKNIK